MVVYCAADLLWATRIKATADALGVPCRPVRSLDVLRARLADSDVKGLIVDLESGETGLGLIAALRGGAEQGEMPVGGDGAPPAVLDPERNVRILAFGPHVAVEALERARAAGADRVLARGAFDRQLTEILRELEGSR